MLCLVCYILLTSHLQNSNHIITQKTVINYSKFVLLQIVATIVSLMLLQIAAGGCDDAINRIFGRRKYTHTGVNKTYAISLL